MQLLVVTLLLHLVVAQERDESERPVEYTIKIQLPVEYGVDEVFSHTIQTSRIKGNSFWKSKDRNKSRNKLIKVRQDAKKW